jgi:hypothetical protein
MTTRTSVALTLLVMLTTGCTYMPPVRLEAGAGDLEILTGHWKGEYDSPALGRHGSVEFKLTAGENRATGSVLMTPQGSATPYGRSSLAHPQDSTSGQPPAQMLSIRFVRASSGAVSGMLDPYWDPDRNCEAQTVFNGTVVERTIEGTFTTRFDCGAGEASGRWHVTRQASK